MPITLSILECCLYCHFHSLQWTEDLMVHEIWYYSPITFDDTGTATWYMSLVTCKLGAFSSSAVTCWVVGEGVNVIRHWVSDSLGGSEWRDNWAEGSERVPEWMCAWTGWVNWIKRDFLANLLRQLPGWRAPINTFSEKYFRVSDKQLYV